MHEFMQVMRQGGQRDQDERAKKSPLESGLNLISWRRIEETGE
jgi:hypothetical protein